MFGTRLVHVTESENEIEWLTPLRETSECSLANENPGEARLDHRRATGSISRTPNDKWQLRIFLILITTNTNCSINSGNRTPPTQRKGFRLFSKYVAHTTLSPCTHLTHYSVQPSSVLRVLPQITTKNLLISSVLFLPFSPSRPNKMVCSTSHSFLLPINPAQPASHPKSIPSPILPSL